MSTRTKIKKNLLLALVIILSLFIIAFLWALRYDESAERISQSWDVEVLLIDGERVENEFSTRGISFKKENKVLLPNHKLFKRSALLRYSRWDYTRVGLIDGMIAISNDDQNLFNRDYDIEFLDNRKPELLKLTSDNVTIYLRGYIGFSTTNTTIKTRPYYIPSEDTMKLEDFKIRFD